jgi:hypothetical protein
MGAIPPRVASFPPEVESIQPKVENPFHPGWNEGGMMNVGEVLNLFKEGKNSKTVGEILGCSASHIGRQLKRIGYSWDNSAKVWHWAGEGEEPLETLVSTPSIPPRVESIQPKVENPFHPGWNEGGMKMESNPSLFHLGLNEEEIDAVRLMIREWKGNQEPLTSKKLRERIKGLEPEETTKKNIVLYKSVGKRLDDFCLREKVNKQDVLNLALMDFIERYSRQP